MLKSTAAGPFPIAGREHPLARPFWLANAPLRGNLAIQLQTNLRLAATVPVVGAPALRPREEREPRPVEGSGRGLGARTRSAGEQAAILHWGGGLDAAPPREQEDERLAGEVSSAPGGEQELSGDEQQVVEELQRRDREVRAHEQTHRSVGGAYAGGIHLDFEVGPDGKRYAVAGSTPIDVAAVPGDPEATLRKMEVVQRAAMAPASPSGADHQVAAHAAQQAQQARAEMAAERYGRARELAHGGDAGEQAAAPQSSASGSAPPAGSLLALHA